MTRTLSEGEGKTCPGCGGLGWIPAGDEQLGCIDCNGKGTIEPAPPASAEVREAAEALRSHIDSVWAITPEEFDSAGQPGVAKTIRLARRLLAAIRANASPAPGSEEAREAEDELERIDNLLARRITLDGLTRVQKIALALRVCEETDPKGEVAARYVCRGGQKGGEE